MIIYTPDLISLFSPSAPYISFTLIRRFDREKFHKHMNVERIAPYIVNNSVHIKSKAHFLLLGIGAPLTPNSMFVRNEFS